MDRSHHFLRLPQLVNLDRNREVLQNIITGALWRNQLLYFGYPIADRILVKKQSFRCFTEIASILNKAVHRFKQVGLVCFLVKLQDGAKNIAVEQIQLLVPAEQLQQADDSKVVVVYDAGVFDAMGVDGRDGLADRIAAVEEAVAAADANHTVLHIAIDRLDHIVDFLLLGARLTFFLDNHKQEALFLLERENLYIPIYGAK
jgi:hypothetical protein